MSSSASEPSKDLPYLSQPYNFSVCAYHFSDNYDCSACGRVNQPHGIIVWNWGASWAEYCSSCIWEIAPSDELEAWEIAVNRIEEGRDGRG